MQSAEIYSMPGMIAGATVLSLLNFTDDLSWSFIYILAVLFFYFYMAALTGKS